MNSQMVTRIKDGAIKAKDLIVGERKALLKKHERSRGIGSTIMKSEIVKSIALTHKKVGMNVATFIGIGVATTGQTCNVGLTTSQTTLGRQVLGGGMYRISKLGHLDAKAPIPIILNRIGVATIDASPLCFFFCD